MDDFIIIGWPEIQKYMELEGFEENTALITPPNLLQNHLHSNHKIL